MKRLHPFFKIGILGGGQLAKMMVQKAKEMGFYVTVLDPSPKAPAVSIADAFIQSSLEDEAGIKKLISQSDVTTYDIEHVNTQALKKFEEQGAVILPKPSTLETIQDKFVQKKALADAGIAVPKFAHCKNPSEKIFSEFGFPLVQKTTRGGYDGGGVRILQNASQFKNAFSEESILEEVVPIQKELAVLIARGRKGEIASYPVVEMTFDPAKNILDTLLVPARISEDLAKEATKLAIRSVEALDVVGICGVELFWTKPGELLVNELAPRPHNSGHYTLEACLTDQFEQHLRAVLGLPLGDTTLFQPAVLLNLLGEENANGVPVLEGLDETLSIPGLSFHFYGKDTVRSGRKMGHLTVMNPSLDVAIEKTKEARKHLKVRGAQ